MNVPHQQVLPDVAYFSVPQMSIVVQSLLKTHKWVTLLLWVTCSSVTDKHGHCRVVFFFFFKSILHTPSAAENTLSLRGTDRMGKWESIESHRLLATEMGDMVLENIIFLDCIAKHDFISVFWNLSLKALQRHWDMRKSWVLSRIFKRCLDLRWSSIWPSVLSITGTSALDLRFWGFKNKLGNIAVNSNASSSV